MSPEDFADKAPGQLVPTTAYESYLKNGIAQTRPATGLAFVPNPLPVACNPADLLIEVIEPLSAAQRGIGRLDGLAADVSVGKLLAAPLMRREAALSSKIENTIATPRDLTLFDAGQPPQRQDTIEVHNYLRALNHGLSSGLPVCLRLVREMHQLLLERVRGHDQSPGRFRVDQNWIGPDPSDFSSARYVPPPPDRLDQLLRNIEAYWNGNLLGGSAPLPPLVHIAIAHYQFEAILPFDDGNGRLGRLIVALSIMRAGLLGQPILYVSGYFERHHREYYDRLLRVSTHGRWEDWIRFFLEAVADHAQDACSRMERIKEERRRVLEALPEVNAHGRVIPLVDHLIEHQWVDASRVQQILNVSDPTARADLKKLEKIGFARPIARGGGARQPYAQVWLATTILDIISEGIEPPTESVPAPPK